MAKNKSQKNDLRRQQGAIQTPQKVNLMPNAQVDNSSQDETPKSQEQVDKPHKPETSKKDSVMKGVSDSIKGWLLGTVDEELKKCDDSFAQVRDVVDSLTLSSDNLKLCMDDARKTSAMMFQELSLLQQDNRDLNEEIKRRSEELPRKISEAKKTARQEGYIEGQKEGYSKGEVEGNQKGQEEMKLRILYSLQNQFKDIVGSNVMTPEEGLRLIANKLNVLKTQLCNTKGLETQLEDAKRKEQEAIAKAETIQNSDKGELINELDIARSRVTELKKSLQAKIDEVNTLTLQLKSKNQEVETLTKQISNRDEALFNEEKQHSQDINQLKVAHVKELTEKLASQKEFFDSEKARMQETYNANKAKLEKQLKDKDEFHTNTVDKLNADHAAAIKQLNAENEVKISAIEKKHTDEVSALNSAHSAKVDALEKEHSAEIERKNTDLKKEETAKKEVAATLAAEAETTRCFTLELASQLAEIAEGEEAILSCCSDFDEVAQGKSSELKSASQALLKELNALPQTKTPSEWIGKVTVVLTELLDNRSSIVNRILKYYCMSSLPFMIDEQRDNGMYFNRKQIKRLFNVIMGLLTQCDITVQLPTLFVENVHDDDYETENTFNDVESFCPGSIKDHISNVERDDEGKNDIIVGVSRIGYTLPNGKSVKTVVII